MVLNTADRFGPNPVGLSFPMPVYWVESQVSCCIGIRE